MDRTTLRHTAANLLAVALLALGAGSALAGETTQTRMALARPTPEQRAFQDLEVGAFFHFGLKTCLHTSNPDGQAPASGFNPVALNAEQWILTAKSMGAKYAVLTARHEDGFCLWPTQTTDYSLKHSPYQGGHGDVVREFVTACRKYGLKPGFYHTATFDAHHRLELGDKGDSANTNSPLTQSAAWHKYRDIQVGQITELLSNYGPIDYLWFDHWNGTDPTFRAVTDTARRLQPRCVLLGPDTWVTGTESGFVVYPVWNAVNTIDGTGYSRPARTAADATAPNDYGLRETDALTGHPLGKFWRSREADSTAFYQGGWFWHPGKVSSGTLAEHLDLYYRTVGLGANLILNLPPDDRGLEPEAVVAATKAFGDELLRRFGQPIAELRGVQKGNTIELGWDKATGINTVILMENIADGQKVAQYTLEAWVNGQWTVLKPANRFDRVSPPFNSNPGFETIGHKKIDRIESIVTNRLRLRCLKAVAQPVELRRLAVYNCPSW